MVGTSGATGELLAGDRKCNQRAGADLGERRDRIGEHNLHGAVHRLSQSAACGSDVNPMGDRDLEEKLRAPTFCNPKADVTPLIDAVWGPDQCAHVPLCLRCREIGEPLLSKSRRA